MHQQHVAATCYQGELTPQSALMTYLGRRAELLCHVGWRLLTTFTDSHVDLGHFPDLPREMAG